MEEIRPKGGWNCPGQKEEDKGTVVTLIEETSSPRKESSFLGAGGNTGVLFAWD